MFIPDTRCIGTWAQKETRSEVVSKMSIGLVKQSRRPTSRMQVQGLADGAGEKVMVTVGQKIGKSRCTSPTVERSQTAAYFNGIK